MLVWGLAVGFLMGGTNACPLVGGTDSNPSGGWGLVSGWDSRKLCAWGGSLGSLFTEGRGCDPTWTVVCLKASQHLTDG